MIPYPNIQQITQRKIRELSASLSEARKEAQRWKGVAHQLDQWLEMLCPKFIVGKPEGGNHEHP